MSERIMVYAIVYDSDGREVLRTAEYVTLPECWDFVINSNLPTGYQVHYEGDYPHDLEQA